MSDKSFDEVLRQKVAQLPAEKQPDRDLWQGIDIALAQRKSIVRGHDSIAELSFSHSVLTKTREWFAIKPMALAASVMLVALLSWQGLMKPAGTKVSPGLVAQMTQQHAEQKSVLLASFSESPELTSNWQVQLQELEEAAQAIEAALGNEPENITLLKMLQQVHQQQLQLIETVHAPKWQAI